MIRPFSVVLLGLWRSASGQGYIPAEIDFDKVEIFPLSGGVRDGVSVKLTAKGITPGDPATIAFLTANYEVAFSMEFDATAKVIKRNSFMNNALGEVSTRGGWPWQADVGALAVDFHRTPNSWEITIDGQRSPWFDFAHVTQDSVVYAAVHTALLDGEVVDKRAECAIQCNVDECSSGCTSGTCYSKSGAGECTNNTDTDVGGISCCDGWQVSKVEMDPLPQVGSYVMVFSDQAQVSAACAAFGGDGTACATAAGNKVAIKAIDPATGVFTVWVPQLFAAGAADTIDIPKDVLAAPSIQQSKTLVTSGAIRDDMTVKGLRALITDSVGDAATAGYDKWWFVNMIYFSGGRGGNPQWVSYNAATYSNTKGTATKMYIVDEDVGHTTCEDDTTWKDAQDNTCSNYTANLWCEDHGVATEAFKNATGAETLSSMKGTDGWWATWTCCQCGGGYHADPPNNTALLFE